MSEMKTLSKEGIDSSPEQKDAQVIQLVNTLKESGKDHEAEQVMILVEQLQNIDKSYHAVFQELQDIKLQLNQIQEQLNGKTQMPDRRNVIADKLVSFENRTQNQFQDLQNIRQNLNEKAGMILLKVKTGGAKVLNNVCEFLNIKENLIKLRDIAQSNVSKMENSIEMIDKMSSESSKMIMHMKNIGKVLSGKEVQEVPTAEQSKIAASKGEGLGNKFLSNIRETDAIIHVLRCFEDSNIVHVDGSVDPVRDKEIIDTELQLKDLETVESRLQKEEKRAMTGGDANAKRLVEVLHLYKEALEKGLSARTVELNDLQQEAARDLQLLTNKPVLYVCNVDEASVVNGNKFVEAVKEAVKNEQAEVLVIGAGIEADIAELETYEEKQMFLEDLGLKEAGVNKLIRTAYHLLNLQTFFTAGSKEVRAWTFRKGMKAPQTAGIIHTDFEKGFIRAEVIKYNDYITLGSEAKCKEAGKMSVEGKDYIVQDGDIMHFRFNV